MKKIFERYYVCMDGNIRSVGRVLPLKTWTNHNGYKKISLYVGGGKKNVFVHRLVAEAYIKNPQKLPHVNHKNGDRTDNRVKNLEWCTPKQNNDHAIAMGTAACVSQRVLTDENRRMIRALRSGGFGAMKISKALGLSYYPVSDYLRGRSYRFDPIE